MGAAARSHLDSLIRSASPLITPEIFLSDQKGGVILKFTPDGKRSTFASGLVRPLFLAFDSAGNLFALDVKERYEGTILKFAPDGSRSVFARSGLRQDDFVNDAGPVIDQAGNLFISDSGGGNTAILKFAPDGRHTTFFPGLGNPQPNVLGFDHTGNLYVALTVELTPEYTEISPDGKKDTFATGTDAIGMAFDKAGNLFVADDATGSILRFAPDGTKSEFAHEVASISPDEKCSRASRICARTTPGPLAPMVIGCCAGLLTAAGSIGVIDEAANAASGARTAQ